MDPRPTLTMERLVLRPFTLADAPEVQRLAGTREVALNTLHIPHPYPDGAAEEWIRSQDEKPQQYTFAITLREDGSLIGAIGLIVAPEDERAEIGYWIAAGQWGKGYASEAARAVIDFGFGALGLQRIFAFHFARNPASGRVMQKLGMRHEGSMRQHFVKWGERIDVEWYGILRDEWTSPDLQHERD